MVKGRVGNLPTTVPKAELALDATPRQNVILCRDKIEIQRRTNFDMQMSYEWVR